MTGTKKVQVVQYFPLLTTPQNSLTIDIQTYEKAYHNSNNPSSSNYLSTTNICSRIKHLPTRRIEFWKSLWNSRVRRCNKSHWYSNQLHIRWCCYHRSVLLNLGWYQMAYFT